MDFYEAWHFLNNHPMFRHYFARDLLISVVKVNPYTNAIDDDEFKNTSTRVWLEHGPYVPLWHECSHDIDLDCGGATFEEAIVELAELVKEHYKDNGDKRGDDIL